MAQADTSWFDALPPGKMAMPPPAAPSAQAGRPSLQTPTSVITPTKTGQTDTSWFDALPPGKAVAQSPPANTTMQGAGLRANLAAGANEQIFSGIGAPVDLAQGAINLAGRGVNAVAGTHIQPIKGAVGGSDWLKQQWEHLTGVNPDTVLAVSEGERVARGVGSGVASVPMMALGAAGLGGALPETMPVAKGALNTVAEASAPSSIAPVAAGSAVGQVAEDASPDWAKPYTGLAGNIAGAAGLSATPWAARKTWGGLVNAGQTVGIVPKQSIGGINVTRGQANKVGDQLLKAAGPEGQQAVAAGVPETDAIPNVNPTTAQLMAGSMEQVPTGIAEMDRTARVANQPAFNARAAEQNNALVSVVRNPAGDIPDTAERLMPGQHFTQMLHDIDARHAGEATEGREAIQTAGQTAIDAAQQAAEQQRGELTQQAQQAKQQVQGAVQIATQKVGGTMDPDAVGQVVKGSLSDRNKAAGAINSAAWKALDPENKLNMPLTETQKTASSLLAELDPRLGDALDPTEAVILQGAAQLPDVTPFRNVGRLWSNISRAQRTLEGQDGSAQSLRRLTMLKNSLSNDVQNGVSASAASDQAVAARVQAFTAKQAADRAAVAQELAQREAMYGGPVAGEADRPGNGERPGGIQAEGPEGAGGMGQSAGRPSGVAGDSAVAATEPVAGNAAGVASLAEPEANQGIRPNIDAGLTDRYQTARQGTFEQKQTYGTGAVGRVLRTGKQRIEDAAVAKQFLTGNSTEPARVQKFISAVGGEPEAVAAMREALVSDLRKKGIFNEDGMVQPDRLKRWIQPEARGRTVDLFPGLREELGTAEAAQRTHDQVVADHVARLDAFNKQAAADHLAKVKSLEGNLKDFDKQAAAARKNDIGAFNKTGGQFVGTEQPVNAMKRIFASKTGTQDLQTVVEQAKGNPEVLDGLKRIAADMIEEKYGGIRPSDNVDADFLKNGLRKWIDDRRDQLKVIFGGQGVQNLDRVASFIRRQQLAAEASASAGSPTAGNLHGLAKAGHIGVGGFGGTAMAFLLEHGVEHVSGLLSSGPIASGILATGGILGGLLAHNMRQAGITTRNALIRESMLHPAVANELMQRAASNNQISQMSQRRIARAIQASIVNNAIGQSNQEPKQ